MSVALYRGLSRDHRAAAAALYWQAFGGKLGRVMGPEPRALRFIAQVIREGHAISAVDADGSLVGVVGFRTPRGSFVGGSWADLVDHYGRIGALWRAACLHLLAHDLEPRVMMVDGIAVRPDRRGAGVGRALIEALAAEARQLGYETLSLDVIEENLRARALYHRLGFEVSGRRSSALTRLIFEFRSVQVMRRAL
ncbi:GNAT family N-acetyltransferase [Thioclava atlantica]|uniref:GNAT family acetyltransferase n=1 Tax=Thioclava atlantica TaxID=1317124 RepID=A0A085TZ54_9RHOB|nr:GNAT family N-acetyltransferase [Thioclava atlantica]KFE36001.1 GNAT family acetyltransferase [Thioclava atlantica]